MGVSSPSRSAAPGPLDEASADWVRTLSSTGAVRDEAVARLHSVLVRVARVEVQRRRGTLGLGGPELDDIAHQAAAHALMAITGKLGDFRGESRFTTWAYRFVVLEVSSKIGRHFWRHPSVALADEDWDRLPDRLGLDPHREAQSRELVDAVHHAVDAVLTPHQRRVFVSIVLDGIPLDAMTLELGCTRNAIYKTMFDARRRLRAELVASGLLTDEAQPEGRGHRV